MFPGAPGSAPARSGSPSAASVGSRSRRARRWSRSRLSAPRTSATAALPAPQGPIRAGQPLRYPKSRTLHRSWPWRSPTEIWPCVMLQSEWLGSFDPPRGDHRRRDLGHEPCRCAGPRRLRGRSQLPDARTGRHGRAAQRRTSGTCPDVELPEPIDVMRAADLGLSTTISFAWRCPRGRAAVRAAHGERITGGPGCWCWPGCLVPPLGTMLPVGVRGRALRCTGRGRPS